MTTEKQGLIHEPAVAAADLSSSQYKIVKLGSSGWNVATTTGEDGVLGILQNQPESGEVCNVVLLGSCKAILGGTVTLGADLTVNASALLIAATSDDQFVIARALEAGVLNDKARVTVGMGTGVGNSEADKWINPTLAGLAATDDPALSEADYTVSTGTSETLHDMTLPDGTKLGYWPLGAGQTITGPVGAVDSLDIAGDQADNEGFEIFSNAYNADGRPYCVGVDGAFFMWVKINTAVINGCDDLFIGFRQLELIQTNMEDYQTYFGLGLNTAATPGAIKVREELAAAGAVNTDTTQTIASATDYQVKILVSAAGVATAQHDAAVLGTLAAPTVTSAFTFPDGAMVMPEVRFLHANVAQAGVIGLKKYTVSHS